MALLNTWVKMGQVLMTV